MASSNSVTWQQLYADLYRQVNGENCTSAEIAKDVRQRRRIIRDNRARLEAQELAAIAAFGNDGGPDYPGRHQARIAREDARMPDALRNVLSQRPRTDSEQTSAVYQYCPSCGRTVHGLFSPAGWVCSECARTIPESRAANTAARKATL